MGFQKPLCLAVPASNLQHPLLNCAACDQPEHHHTALLTHAVCTCQSLQVIVRVPVAVKDNDCVSSGQVDAQTSGSSAQQEHKLPVWLAVEAVNTLLALQTRHITCNSKVRGKA